MKNGHFGSKNGQKLSFLGVIYRYSYSGARAGFWRVWKGACRSNLQKYVIFWCRKLLLYWYCPKMVGDTAGEMIKIDQKWVIYHIYGDSEAPDLLLGIIETPCILEFISDDYHL